MYKSHDLPRNMRRLSTEELKKKRDHLDYEISLREKNGATFVRKLDRAIYEVRIKRSQVWKAERRAAQIIFEHITGLDIDSYLLKDNIKYLIAEMDEKNRFTLSFEVHGSLAGTITIRNAVELIRSCAVLEFGASRSTDYAFCLNPFYTDIYENAIKKAIEEVQGV